MVIDPILARKLRPHQIEGRNKLAFTVISTLSLISGVKFMYECVMAMKGHDGKGCILADEMYVQPAFFTAKLS